VLLFWLVLSVVWGALHWVIVPRIDEFRPLLQVRVGQALGIPVRLGPIVASSNGLIPSFELSDVELFDGQGRVALKLSRVAVALSPRSLWRLGFEQVVIDHPTLDVRRLADGRFTVAGLEMTGPDPGDSAALNWFFSQAEFVIAGGRVRYSDELRQAPPVELQQVDVVVRNVGRHHDLRLDATPPLEWGERLSLRGQFTQPLLELQRGRWRQWQGQAFVVSQRVDLSQLQRYVELGFELRQGQGAMRAWVDISNARVTAVLADVALTELDLKLGAELPAATLQQVQGRVGVRLLPGGLELSGHGVAFATPEGLRWPAGDFRWKSVVAQDGVVAHGELWADRFDLAALAQLAESLPLHPSMRQQLMAHAPKGQINAFQANWQGELEAPSRYQAQGQLRQIEFAAQAPWPGVRGLEVDFQLDQDGGRATLAMSEGSLDLSGVLPDGVLALDQVAAQVRWVHRGEDWSVEVPELQFANADAQGKAKLSWRTLDPQRAPGRSRFPGYLDVQASLSRADASQLHRYLPLAIDAQARHYLREAVQAGSAHDVTFVVQGELDRLPTADPRQGAFRVTVPFKQVDFAYVPRVLQPAAEAPWPTLHDASGVVVISGHTLQVRDVRARLGEPGALQVVRAQASIGDLRQPRVDVEADLKGPLADAFKVVRTSPLNALTGQALANASASGPAELALKLSVPVADPARSTVAGSVRLVGNEVQFSPGTPRLLRTRGLVSFTENGLGLSGMQTHLLGGDAKLEGGLQFAATTAGASRQRASAIRVTGVVSAEGLRQASELGFVAALASYLYGSANYTATVGLSQYSPDILITSNLLGMGSTLPLPMQKSQTTSWPISLHLGPAKAASGSGDDRIELTLADRLGVTYERSTSGGVSRVARGLIRLGADTLGSLELQQAGVRAHIDVPRLDLEAWSDIAARLGWFSRAGGTRVDPRAVDFLPTTLALRTDSLVLGGRDYQDVVLGAAREGTLWRINARATELDGYLEYRPPVDTVAGSGGRVYARLARLTLAPAQASAVESLMDAAPTSIPALDVVVEDFELRGIHLGRLEVDAVNRLAHGGAGAAREWRLNKLNLGVPEATLVANGNWGRLPASDDVAPLGAATPERRRTLLSFRLEVNDSGKLLARFGMPGVVRQGNGKIEGQASWLGSPLKPDYPTLSGALAVNVVNGQFLKAEPGLAKLLGVLSLQALPRRLTLDFRDVFSEGFAFDFLRGDVTLSQGIARTNNLQMKGVNAAVLMDGQANLATETQDLKVVVVPELNAGTASLIATVINPAIGLGSFLAQWLLRRPLTDSATQEFHIDGGWADPQVRKVPSTPAPNQESKP